MGKTLQLVVIQISFGYTIEEHDFYDLGESLDKADSGLTLLAKHGSLKRFAVFIDGRERQGKVSPMAPASASVVKKKFPMLAQAGLLGCASS